MSLRSSPICSSQFAKEEEAERKKKEKKEEAKARAKAKADAEKEKEGKGAVKKEEEKMEEVKVKNNGKMKEVKLEVDLKLSNGGGVEGTSIKQNTPKNKGPTSPIGIKTTRTANKKPALVKTKKNRLPATVKLIEGDIDDETGPILPFPILEGKAASYTMLFMITEPTR